MKFVERKEIPVPTLYGWAAILLLACALTVASAASIYPFLAVTSPVYGGDLVIEGWVPDDVYDEVIREFRRHPYRKLYVTGGEIEFASMLPCKTYAECGASLLRSKGFPADLVEAVPSPSRPIGRTYDSALALRAWLEHEHVPIRSCHVITLGPHARRTRLIFERAFGEGVPIGVTAVNSGYFDPSHWWRSSSGVKTVFSEAIAYASVRTYFLLH